MHTNNGNEKCLKKKNMIHINSVIDIDAVKEIISNKSQQLMLDLADFELLDSTLEEGKVIVVGTGVAKGKNRVAQAISQALQPLSANGIDIQNSEDLYLYVCILCSENCQLHSEELEPLHAFLLPCPYSVSVIWGYGYDNSLGEGVKVIFIVGGISAENVSDTSGLQVYCLKTL